jgi:hypothetical protein
VIRCTYNAVDGLGVLTEGGNEGAFGSPRATVVAAATLLDRGAVIDRDDGRAEFHDIGGVVLEVHCVEEVQDVWVVSIVGMGSTEEVLRFLGSWDETSAEVFGKRWLKHSKGGFWDCAGFC